MIYQWQNLNNQPMSLLGGIPLVETLLNIFLEGVLESPLYERFELILTGGFGFFFKLTVHYPFEFERFDDVAPGLHLEFYAGVLASGRV